MTMGFGKRRSRIKRKKHTMPINVVLPPAIDNSRMSLVHLGFNESKALTKEVIDDGIAAIEKRVGLWASSGYLPEPTIDSGRRVHLKDIPYEERPAEQRLPLIDPAPEFKLQPSSADIMLDGHEIPKKKSYCAECLHEYCIRMRMNKEYFDKESTVFDWHEPPAPWPPHTLQAVEEDKMKFDGDTEIRIANYHVSGPGPWLITEPLFEMKDE